MKATPTLPKLIRFEGDDDGNPRTDRAYVYQDGDEWRCYQWTIVDGQHVLTGEPFPTWALAVHYADIAVHPAAELIAAERHL